MTATSVASRSPIRVRNARAASIVAAQAGRQRDEPHRHPRPARVGQVGGGHPQRVPHHPLAVRGERGVVRPYPVDAETAQREQARRRGQPGRVVERRLPLEPGRETRLLLPGHHQRLDPVPPLRATASRAVPRGAYAHLCRLPTQKSAPMLATGVGSMPGACAASTRTGTPCSRATADDRGGRQEPGGGRGELVDDEQPGPAGAQAGADDLRRSRSSVAASGTGRIRLTAPVRRHSAATARLTAPYPWSVLRTSSPGRGRATGGPRRRRWWRCPPGRVPSGSAPRNAARCRRVCAIRSTRPWVKNRSGLASISSRSRCWARCTPIGTAPNEPWLRWRPPGRGRRAGGRPGIGSGGCGTLTDDRNRRARAHSGP